MRMWPVIKGLLINHSRLSVPPYLRHDGLETLEITCLKFHRYYMVLANTFARRYELVGWGGGSLCVDGGLDGTQEVACTNVSPLPTLISVINLVNYSPLEPFNRAALFDLSDGSLNILRGRFFFLMVSLCP